MAPFSTDPNAIGQMKDRASALRSSLSESDTAYSRSAPVISSDLSKSQSLSSLEDRIKQTQSLQTGNRWYGASAKITDPGAEGSTTDGLFMRGIKGLQKPMNVIAGTAEYALGEGTDPNYFTSVNQAMSTGRTFGDILRKKGVTNRLITTPIGFALDVAFDPVNWFTMGGAALIPRVGIGAVKGARTAGVEGAITAAKEGLISGVQKKTAKVLPWVFPAKTIGKMGAEMVEGAAKTGGTSGLGALLSKTGSKYGEFVDSVGKSAVARGDKYDALVGNTLESQLGKNFLGIHDINVGKTMGEGVQKLLRDIPEFSVPLTKIKTSGKEIADFFKYSPQETLKIVAEKERVDLVAKSYKLFFDRDLKGEKVLASLDDLTGTGITDSMSLKQKLEVHVKNMLSEADQAAAPKFRIADTQENAQRLLDATEQGYSLEHLIKAYETTPKGKTGVAAYDKIIDSIKGISVKDIVDKTGTGSLARSMGIYDKVKDWTPFEKMIDWNDAALALFKVFKVPGSVSAFFNAVVGNATMVAMSGAPADPRLLSATYKMNKFLRGKTDMAFVSETFMNDAGSWLDMLENNPNLFREAFGFSPSMIGNKVSFERSFVNHYGQEAGAKITRKSVEAQLKYDLDFIQTDLKSSVVRAAAGEAELSADQLKELAMVRHKLPTGLETQQLLEEVAPLRSFEQSSSYIASELNMSSIFDSWKIRAAKSAKETNNPVSKVSNLLLNSMPRAYEMVDQSWKLGLTYHLSRVGWPLENLTILSRTVPMAAADIASTVIEKGERLYRLTPKKAAEASTEVFMNYAAMPDFVKIMRSLPVVGSPFVSFTYAMAPKTGKTLLHNTAIFNKVSFLLQEINGARTPEEKKALESKYNQYLNSPTVVKLGGMWNTDVKNLIPYYTMNMFNPSERKYDSAFPSTMIKLMDNSPFMKHPVGQTLFDYLIQPAVLAGSGQVPQGQFGQPLFPGFDTTGRPVDVGLGVKTAYAARTLADSMTPGIMSYAGLANYVVGLRPEQVEWIPSFGLRGIARATQGANTVGVLTKENPIQRTLRTTAARSGFPLYPLNIKQTGGQ